MPTDDKLHRAYALQTPSDAKALYADWAASYDADFIAASQYILHLNVVSAFIAAGGTAPVLDIGAGTGACGEAFRQQGLRPVDAMDISADMLAVAQTKGVYDTLFTADILTGSDRPDGCYPGIVSAGTFTLGHVGPEGLDEVVRLLAPGGLAVIAVRDAHYNDAEFDSKLLKLEPVLHAISAITCRIYANTETGPHADDMAILLHLRKA